MGGYSPTTYDGNLYDFNLVLPESVSGERRNELFLQGIGDHFHIDLIRESRTVDTYVVTAPASKLQPRKTRRGGENRGSRGGANRGSPDRDLTERR